MMIRLIDLIWCPQVFDFKTLWQHFSAIRLHLSFFYSNETCTKCLITFGHSRFSGNTFLFRPTLMRLSWQPCLTTQRLAFLLRPVRSGLSSEIPTRWRFFHLFDLIISDSLLMFCFCQSNYIFPSFIYIIKI